MSSLYIVLFCKFYVTIWCKDNKLIIYLSITSIEPHYTFENTRKVHEKTIQKKLSFISKEILPKEQLGAR